MLITQEIFQSSLNCKTKSYLKFSGEIAPHNEFDIWQRRQIKDYKQKCTDQLRSKFREDTYLTSVSFQQVVENKNCCIVFDCMMDTKGMQSLVHAVECILSPTNRKHRDYLPIHFVPSEKITKQDRLLLAYDALVLSTITKQIPPFGKIIYGREQKVTKVKLAELIKMARAEVAKITEQQTSQTVPQVVLNKHCPQCEFQNQCYQLAEEKDDLSLLAGMTIKERKKQHEKGIFTVTQLSYTFRPRRRPKRLASKPEKYHHALKALAIREHKIHIVGRPELKVTGNPIYLDVEGDQDQNFYYLVGLRIKNDASYIQRSYWADTVEGEKAIWSSLIQTLSEIENPQLIYFGSYEKAFMKRMKERYGSVVENSDYIDELISESMNLVSIIYGQIYFPVYTSSLKKIAQFLGYNWSENSATGLSALMWRWEWELSNDARLKQKLITYNTEDCEALERVANSVFQLCQNQNEGENPGDSSVVYTDSLKHASVYKFGSREFLIPELQYINQAAYWNYQRKKIYPKQAQRSKRRSPKKTKRHARIIRVNQTIECQTPDYCPQCKSTQIIKGRKMSRLIYDLKFGRTGVKRWIVRYKFYRYSCKQCGTVFHYTPRPWTGGKYGPNTLAYIMYQIIELRLSMRVVAQHINQLFNINISRFEVLRQKAKVAQIYEDTYELILNRLVNGSLVHADETRSGIKRDGSYVWVLANWEEVAYFYTKTRDGSLIQEKMKDFTGVLVSDFYAVYDSVECRQQRCLIHLLRDMDEDLHKQSLNEELKELVEGFAELLRLIIKTINRFGLKARHLRKHKISVKRFRKWLSKKDYKSNIVIKYKKRLEKNDGKLFTFLDCDNVPWNNNNAEHAIKAFARLRSSLHGMSTENGLKDYLILLSIYQTCKYKGANFLDFLCSGEKDIDTYIQKKKQAKFVRFTTANKTGL